MAAASTSARVDLRRFAVLSILAAIVTIGLKAGAYLMTGSVSLLSDALESLVNLAAAVFALGVLTVAARPADEEHPYGHEKAEYFGAGVEGVLILLAAVSIGWTSIDRLRDPQPLEAVWAGLAVAVVASAVNLVVALRLRTAGRDHRSAVLQADATHLLTDVLTSAGVIAGVAAVTLTGWERLDPLIALAVGVNIVVAGVRLVRHASDGLLDRALPAAERAAVDAVLARHAAERHVRFHALRSRQSGSRRFVSVHVLVPGEWSVQRGHDLLEEVEADLRDVVPGLTVFTHLEPIEDPVSFEDRGLDRTGPA